jgi:hypothetical protein
MPLGTESPRLPDIEGLARSLAGGVAADDPAAGARA